MFHSSSTSYKTLLKQFKNVPAIINPSKIDIITDIGFLSQLENKYDVFLEKNMLLLDLYNIIDELLFIRDAIILQVCRLKRKKSLNEHYKLLESEKKTESETNHSNSLTLTHEQKEMGYSQSITKEYTCGCKTRQYQLTQNKTKQTKVIQKQQYCFKHLHYYKTKQILETELTKINIELSSIIRKENEV